MDSIILTMTAFMVIWGGVMKYLVKKVGNFWQARKVSFGKIIYRAPMRVSRIDAFMDAKNMEDVEKRWEKKDFKILTGDL